jgi:hypothetical protein
MRDAAFALKPGESEQAQWPLNFWYQFEGEGEYEVSVTGHTEDEILVRIHAVEGLGHSGDASYPDVDKPLLGGQGRAHSAGCHGGDSHSRERQTPYLSCNAHHPRQRKPPQRWLVQFHGALRRVAAAAVKWVAVVAIDGRSFHYDVNDRFVGLRYVV